jgi:hypothetical protein
LVDLNKQLLEQIEKGLLEDANRTVELLIAQSSHPSVCNRETLNALRKARTLALIQRSHLQRQLRMAHASRLFHTPVEAGAPTVQIDG